MVRVNDIFSFEYFELLKKYSNKYTGLQIRLRKNI